MGIVIHTQPFFIAGIEDESKARANAFGAMGMFLVTFLASVGGMYYDSQNKVEHMVDAGEEGEYRLAPGDVPTYGTSS